MSDVIEEQFARMIASLPAEQEAALRVLEASGFLDLLTPEASGGAGLNLEDALPLALIAGKRLVAAPVLEMVVARALMCEPGALPRAAAAATTAALMAGALEAVLGMTVEYAGVRNQFGRPISKFQAVQHQLAVMAEEVMAGRMAAQIAFRGPAAELTAARAAVAKIRVGEAAQVVVANAHAVHGAIGISEEYGLQRYTTQLWTWRMAHGGESWWAEELGRMLLAGRQTMLDFARDAR